MVDVLVNLALILGSIFVLVVITDHFFIVSLDQISQRLQLSDEVAGASLMAIGSSAPELSIALIALFTGGGAHSDVGIGTIVGSAVFNILVITGASAVAAGGLRVHIRPVKRDTACYVLSIVYLAAVFWDGEIVLAEALLGLVAYAGYMLLLIFYKLPPDATATAPPVKAAPADAPPHSRMQQLQVPIVRLIGLLSGAPEKNYLRAFLLSIGFIVALSYILVEATVVFAAGIGIPPVIVALTLLAAGTSAPDLISSVEVARAGRGGMAVANALGSNIFDIFVGLGFPWLVALSIQNRASVHVESGDMVVSIGILLVTTLILYALLASRLLLSRREGWLLLLFYLVFAAYTVLAGTAV